VFFYEFGSTAANNDPAFPACVTGRLSTCSTMPSTRTAISRPSRWSWISRPVQSWASGLRTAGQPLRRRTAPPDRPSPFPVSRRAAKAPWSRRKYRIIYGDTDQMGSSTTGNYLRFFEAARTSGCGPRRTLARDRGRAQHLLPVVEAKVNYKRPAFYDDVIEIEARLGDLGRASAAFRLPHPARRGSPGPGPHGPRLRQPRGDMKEFPEPLLERLRAGQ